MTSESSTDLREILNEINELRKELLNSKLLMEDLKNEINYSGKILDKNLYLVNLSQKEKSTTYIITFISIILLTFTSIFFFTKLSIENTSSQINLIKDIVLSNYTKSTASTEHSQAERPPKEFPAPIGVSGESLANKILNEFVSNSIELSSKESSESKKEFSLQISAVIDSLLSAGLIAAKKPRASKTIFRKQASTLLLMRQRL
ncbi:hypothetical protein [Comamonas thiooxydans]|uniref:hypothetical protein n=1 Tax=Comamonas thiooxydans TaxID=363952 RepID=UPI0001BB17A8|nr:hypothetical protein [Comamonas thiooxydans]ACY33180.1 hypothetical protein CtCNB1_2434 [Comamonas thiooxydans]